MSRDITYLDEVERLKQAVHKHDRLLDQGDMSVATGIGYVAVVCSLVSTEGSSPLEGSEGDKQIVSFMKETDLITNDLTATGRKAEKIITTSITDIDTVIKDELCSDLVLIGNGAYSSLWLNGSHLTWWNLSQRTDHLKQGVFYQRTCGHFLKGKLNVSLGTFLMRDHTRIHAPVGKFIDDESPSPNDFTRVYQSAQMKLGQLIEIDNRARKKLA